MMFNIKKTLRQLLCHNLHRQHLPHEGGYKSLPYLVVLFHETCQMNSQSYGYLPLSVGKSKTVLFHIRLWFRVTEDCFPAISFCINGLITITNPDYITRIQLNQLCQETQSKICLYSHWPKQKLISISEFWATRNYSVSRAHMFVDVLGFV